MSSPTNTDPVSSSPSLPASSSPTLPPKMSSFPLLKLPLVVQRKIIPELEAVDLVQLAFISKKFKKLMEIIKLKATKIIWKFQSTGSRMEIYFGEDKGVNCEVRTHISSAYRKPVYFANFKGKRLWADYPNSEPRTILMQIWEPEYKSTMKALETFSNYLMPMLKVEQFKVWTEFIRENDFFNCFVWKITKKFAELQVRTRKTQIVTPSEFEFLLEKITVDSLYLSVIPQEKYLKPLQKYWQLQLETSDYMPFETIFKMDSQFLSIRKKLLKSTDINRFIKSWLDGNGLKNLESFGVGLVDGYLHTMWYEVLDGIDTILWDQSVRPAINNSQHNCRNFRQGREWDVRRKTDGQLATVILSKDFFDFVVWHEKYLKPRQPMYPDGYFDDLDD